MFPMPGNETHQVHDYSEMLPVITIIWMVHDTFDFTDDYIAYSLSPETISEFINLINS